MDIEEYKQQKQIKDQKHVQAHKKYEQVTRQRNTFKVYMHVNKYNGRKYIGITCEDVHSRWRGGKAYKVNGHFKNAIEKYGWEEGFEHLILFDNLTQQEAMDKEVELIAKYKNTPEGVYNLTDGGEHYRQTPESIAKMKETKKRNLTPERLQIIKLAAQARDFNGEKNPFYGKTHTTETKQHLSAVHWSKTNPNKFYRCVKEERMGENNPNSKKVVRLYDGKIYNCIKDCLIDNNVSRELVRLHCIGKKKEQKFMYLKDWEVPNEK